MKEYPKIVALVGCSTLVALSVALSVALFPGVLLYLTILPHHNGLLKVWSGTIQHVFALFSFFIPLVWLPPRSVQNIPNQLVCMQTPKLPYPKPFSLVQTVPGARCSGSFRARVGPCGTHAPSSNNSASWSHVTYSRYCTLSNLEYDTSTRIHREDSEE